MAGITLATTAIKLLKDVIELAKESNNADLKGKVSDLQNVLYDLTEENQKLRTRNEYLESNAKVGNELKYEENVFWRMKDGERSDGPYCSACWDDKKKEIHLTPGATKGTYSCNVCKASFRTAEYNAPPLIRSRAFGED